MNIQKILFERFISPIIVGIMVNLIISALSKIQTGSWTDLFFKIDPLYYIIFVLFLITWILIIFLMKRRKTSSISAVGMPRYGYENIGDYEFADVIWKLRVPKQHRFVVVPNPLNRGSVYIDVDSNPRCPDCGTKLEISNGLVWNEWDCVLCDFKKRTKDDVYKIHKRVQKIIDREVEKTEEDEFKKRIQNQYQL